MVLFFIQQHNNICALPAAYMHACKNGALFLFVSFFNACVVWEEEAAAYSGQGLAALRWRRYPCMPASAKERHCLPNMALQPPPLNIIICVSREHVSQISFFSFLKWQKHALKNFVTPPSLVIQSGWGGQGLHLQQQQKHSTSLAFMGSGWRAAWHAFSFSLLPGSGVGHFGLSSLSHAWVRQKKREGKNLLFLFENMPLAWQHAGNNFPFPATTIIPFLSCLPHTTKTPVTVAIIFTACIPPPTPFCVFPTCAFCQTEHSIGRDSR